MIVYPDAASRSAVHGNCHCGARETVVVTTHTYDAANRRCISAALYGSVRALTAGLPVLPVPATRASAALSAPVDHDALLTVNRRDFPGRQRHRPGLVIKMFFTLTLCYSRTHTAKVLTHRQKPRLLTTPRSKEQGLRSPVVHHQAVHRTPTEKPVSASRSVP